MSTLKCIGFKCDADIPELMYKGSGFHRCRSCKTIQNVIATFPALHKVSEEQFIGETLITDEDASCFFHPEKKAALPCHDCGRFICSLCDVNMDDKHFCPTCLNNEADKKEEGIFVKKMIQYDSLAMSISILSFLMWPITCITMFVVFFMCFKFWNKKPSLVRNNKWRFVVAFLIATGQLVGWVIGAFAMMEVLS